MSTTASAEGLCEFIDASPSPFHVCRSAADRLLAAGFTEVSESDAWPGSGDYFAVRAGSLIAWRSTGDHAPFRPDSELMDFRRFFGPEQRDILMFWRGRPKIHFAEHHAREPGGLEEIATDLYCQHYGKSLSLDHWEETCDYYIKHFPFKTYGKKWTERKGKGIHTQSDFARPLYEWGDELFANAVRIER